MSVAIARNRRPLILVCVMLTMAMGAIEVTIVATAMPQIVARLGGFSLYSWVFTSVLLAQAATTVIYGKLADLYGRSPVLIIGIVIFLIGSLMCGLAWSMPSLVVFRLMQGLGAGAMQPLAMTIIGDIYSPEERAGIQGYTAAVWGVSAVIGPLAGGFIVDHWSWHWIFWCNIPFGIAAIAGLYFFLHERVEHKSRSIDYGGAVLVAVAIASFLLVLTFLPERELLSASFLGCCAVFIISVPLLIWQERHVASPIIAVELWTNSLIASASGATLAAGMVFMGATTFLPVYVQAVMGNSATVAGLTLTMMAFGWPVAATMARPLYKRIGTRPTVRLGGFLIVAGSTAFPLLHPGSSVWLPAIGSLIVGFGLGFLMVTCVVLVQGTTEWAKRGSATAALIFSRTLGNTLGASVLGGVLNLGIASVLSGSGTALSPDNIRDLLQQGNLKLPSAHSDPELLKAALDLGLHYAFWGIWLVALLALAVAFVIPPKELHELTGGLPQEG